MQPHKASNLVPTATERQIVMSFMSVLLNDETTPAFQLYSVERLSDAASSLLIQLTYEPAPDYDCVDDDARYGAFADELPELARSFSEKHKCNIIARFSGDDSQVSLGQGLVFDVSEAYAGAISILDTSSYAAEAAEHLKAALLLAFEQPFTPHEMICILLQLAQCYADCRCAELSRVCLDECRRWVDDMRTRGLIQRSPTLYAELAVLEADLGNYDRAQELIDLDAAVSATASIVWGEPPDTQGMSDEESDAIIDRYLSDRERRQRTPVKEIVARICREREEAKAELMLLLDRVSSIRDTSLSSAQSSPDDYIL